MSEHRTTHARTLRELAVDLIRASDLLDGSPEAVESAHHRLRGVMDELRLIEPSVAARARIFRQTSKAA